MRSNTEHMFIITSVGDLLVDNDVLKLRGVVVNLYWIELSTSIGNVLRLKQLRHISWKRK